MLRSFLTGAGTKKYGVTRTSARLVLSARDMEDALRSMNLISLLFGAVVKRCSSGKSCGTTQWKQPLDKFEPSGVWMVYPSITD